jgi:diguanylate cyclase (GGDEF)-like protein
LASLPPWSLALGSIVLAAVAAGLFALAASLIIFRAVRAEVFVIGILAASLAEALTACVVAAVVAHLRAEQKSLERFATVDELTGSPNRRVFLERLDVEVRRADRQGAPLCVVFIDIDFFKRVNDDNGHQVGDAVLKEIFARLEESLRPYDFVGRYGGDEFVMALPGTDEEGGAAAAERLRKSVRDGALGRLAGVTISLGVAALAKGMTAHQLLRAADAALYRAKNRGRNRTETAGASSGVSG